MDKHQKRFADLLDASGATILRRKKHINYRLSNGRLFVVSSTPSDINSYKNAYSDLRRIAAMPVPQEIRPTGPSLDNAVSKASASYRPPAPDQAPREDPEIMFFTLGPTAEDRLSNSQAGIRFDSLSQLVDIADEMDSFWKLSADGRTRVLMKLAQGFADVDVIGWRSYLGSFRAFEWFLVKDDQLEALDGFKWPMPITRSLSIKMPNGSVRLVETESKRVIEGTAQLVTINSGSETSWEERVVIETVGDAPEPELNKYIFHHLIHVSKMRLRGLQFDGNPEWDDPSATRKVMADMLEALAVSGRQ